MAQLGQLAQRGGARGEAGPCCSGRSTYVGRLQGGDARARGPSRGTRPALSVQSVKRSATAFARGERTGALMTSVPSELKTWSKLAVNFVSRSRMRN